MCSFTVLLFCAARSYGRITSSDPPDCIFQPISKIPSRMNSHSQRSEALKYYMFNLKAKSRH